MTKSHSRDDCRVRFGSGSQEGGQSPPNTRKPKSDTQGSGRHIPQYRCSSEEKVRCPWPEKSNDGYADTKPQTLLEIGDARRIGRTQIRVCTDHVQFFTHPSALYVYSFGSAATELI
ncbi:hypothetical protein GB937_010450 [Aspergillus fischeri]|nr:hypothetical protein GB937_010450 [Aspergillus fischeri]